MKPQALTIMILAAGLLGLGSISNHWFHGSAKSYDIAEGVLYSRICAFDLDHDGDALERYARYQETGVQPPPPVWSCKRELGVMRIRDVHRALHFFVWLAELLCVVAGLAAAALLVAMSRGRRVARYIVVLAMVALTAAIVVVVTALQEGYTVSDVGYALVAYVAGAVLAMWCAIRRPLQP